MGKRNSGGAVACVRNKEQNDTDGNEREMAGRGLQVNRQDVSVRERAYCIGEKNGYMCAVLDVCAWSVDIYV
jgi:hypothetical protein